jgi:hypothetical protein
MTGFGERVTVGGGIVGATLGFATTVASAAGQQAANAVAAAPAPPNWVTTGGLVGTIASLAVAITPVWLKMWNDLLAERQKSRDHELEIEKQRTTRHDLRNKMQEQALKLDLLDRVNTLKAVIDDEVIKALAVQRRMGEYLATKAGVEIPPWYSESDFDAIPAAIERVASRLRDGAPAPADAAKTVMKLAAGVDLSGSDDFPIPPLSSDEIPRARS